MMNNIFGNMDILQKGVKASWVRNKVLNENIANVDTPGYKRKDVNFEAYMKKAVSDYNTKDSNLNVRSLEPSIYKDNANYSYRIDGNNVDIDTEMGYLAENQLVSETLVSQINYNFKRIKTVLK